MSMASPHPLPSYLRHVLALCACCLALWLTPGQAQALLPPGTTADQPARQFDYYAQDAAARKRIRVVEQYHWERALDCMRSGHSTCAYKNLAFIVHWVPNHPYALGKLSELMIKEGRPEVAEQHLDDALKFYPRASTYVVYGIHAYRLKRYQAAIEKFQKALELAPDSAEVHYNLGLAYLAAGDHERANTHAQKAYGLGYPLPALREKLKTAGAWQP